MSKGKLTFLIGSIVANEKFRVSITSNAELVEILPVSITVAINVIDTQTDRARNIVQRKKRDTVSHTSIVYALQVVENYIVHTVRSILCNLHLKEYRILILILKIEQNQRIYLTFTII